MLRPTTMACNIPDSAESFADSVDTQACCSRNAENKIFAKVKDNYFIDVRSKEIVDVKNSVEKYLSTLSKEIVSCHPHLRIEKLVAGGSVVENTRVWVRTVDEGEEDPLLPLYSVELDYLAIMSFNGIGFRENKRACPGCINVTYRNRKIDSEYKHFFEFIVYEIFYDLDARQQAQNSWQKKQKEIPNDFDVNKYWSEQLSYLSANGSHRVIEAKSGSLVLISLKRSFDYFGSSDMNYYFHPPLKFIWVRKDQHQGIQKKCGGFGGRVFSVHVDFLPAFELKQDPCLEREIRVSKMLAEANIRNLRSTHIRYVVFKCSANPYDNEDHCCWMVSTMLLEQKLIRRSSENHKDSYKLLKLFILKTDLTLEIRSYVLKTVYLHHLKECAISEGSAEDCYQSMVHSLSRMCNNDFVPHFFYGYNVFVRHPMRERMSSSEVCEEIETKSRLLTIADLCL